MPLRQASDIRPPIGVETSNRTIRPRSWTTRTLFHSRMILSGFVLPTPSHRAGISRAFLADKELKQPASPRWKCGTHHHPRPVADNPGPSEGPHFDLRRNTCKPTDSRGSLFDHGVRRDE